jgi:hypothetical protein
MTDMKGTRNTDINLATICASGQRCHGQRPRHENVLTESPTKWWL